MRGPGLVLFLLCVSASVGLAAQEPTASQAPQAPQQNPQTATVPQAPPFLRRAYAAMTRGARIKSVALTGIITAYGTSGNASSTFSFSADNTGQSRFDIFGGPSEFRTVSGGVPSGSGIGPGGVSYTVSAQNPMTISAWFFPALAVAPRLVARDYAKSYAGRETQDGIVVNHLQTWEQANGATADARAAVKRLLVEDIYLDEMSHMPVLVAFNLHLGNGSRPSVPAQIHFSDYRRVQGCPVAHHIQVYMNGALFWDIQLSSVSLN